MYFIKIFSRVEYSGPTSVGQYNVDNVDYNIVVDYNGTKLVMKEVQLLDKAMQVICKMTCPVLRPLVPELLQHPILLQLQASCHQPIGDGLILLAQYGKRNQALDFDLHHLPEEQNSLPRLNSFF